MSGPAFDWQEEHRLRCLAEHKAELRAKRRILRAAARLAELGAALWVWGDGEGGFVREAFEDAARARGLAWPEPRINALRSITKIVFERDKYRCVKCETWIDLTIDHIVPRAKGGRNDLDNLQTMCRKCNSRKGAR